MIITAILRHCLMLVIQRRLHPSKKLFQGETTDKAHNHTHKHNYGPFILLSCILWNRLLSNNRPTTTNKVNFCSFDHKVFRIIKGSGAISSFWSMDIIVLSSLFNGEKGYGIPCRWFYGGICQSKKWGIHFIFLISLPPWTSPWSLTMMIKPQLNFSPAVDKNWRGTMILWMHPFWYLFSKSPLKIYLLYWGVTLHKLHARI